jgi:hypothetical protein
MKEYFNGDVIPVTLMKPVFKTKITTGTVEIQIQALDEGFDTVENGTFSATATGEIIVKEALIKIVLTGDARFFMSSPSNRLAG